MRRHCSSRNPLHCDRLDAFAIGVREPLLTSRRSISSMRVCLMHPVERLATFRDVPSVLRRLVVDPNATV